MRRIAGLTIGMSICLATSLLQVETWGAPVAIVRPATGSFTEQLAAKEIRRYVYQRTGKLLPLADDVRSAPAGDLIWVSQWTESPANPLVLLQNDELTARIRAIEGPDGYILKTVRHDDRRILVVAGGNPGVLYGAYRLAEHLGVRFYMHGDVLPDERIAWAVPDLDEQATPLFDRRGVQPFHDFPEGPDWWNADGYKAVLAQLPKLRMNFFGLHTYPEGGVGPEPTVWIGLPGDFKDQGQVAFSYASRHFTTGNVTGSWGYEPVNTSDYTFGAAGMYDRDVYAADYMEGTHPWTTMSPETCNSLFDRFGNLLDDAFGFARKLGIKSCIGTETPLVIPKRLQEHLQAQGKNPRDPAVIQQLYEGMFARIAQTHPLDYYWLWTPEGWTWSGTSQDQIDGTMSDLQAAIRAADKVNAPFTLATCGWVLGPQQDRALFDNVLPKDMPMSCINREVGHAPVEPGFAAIEGRPQWAIPWLEDDPAMITPQLWVGRMRRDAVDARKYGCSGLLGIHWRTRILGPNVLALARAAWDQTGLDDENQAETAREPEGPAGGKHAPFPNNAISDTEDDPLYQTVRYDVGAYRLDLPNGKYRVTLKFCEPHYSEHHKRVFGVAIQGKQVIESLDLFRQVGKNRALDYSYDDVQVTDGRLTIDFVYQLEYPCIAAIVIEGPAVRRINCGGPAYQSFSADWPASDNSGPSRHLRADDFYADWTRSQFGPEAAQPIAEIFTQIDGKLPRPATWVNGPGGINPDGRFWDEVAREYAFVSALAKLRPQVVGAGNLERFDYWLDNFRYLKAIGKLNCIWGHYNGVMEKVRAEEDPTKKQRLARTSALPVRRQLVAAVAQVHEHLLNTVNTPGAMGNVTNWQQHIMPVLLNKPGEELAKILGQPLPPDAMPVEEYSGRPRVFLPVLRTLLDAGESLKVDAVILGMEQPETEIHWRPFGAETFSTKLMEHVARGVYSVTLPAESLARDFEYYVQATGSDLSLTSPAAAPRLNHAVVVMRTP